MTKKRFVAGVNYICRILGVVDANSATVACLSRQDSAWKSTL
jgi:hypothetical protein